MLYLNKGPAPMLDIAGAMTAKAVFVAIRLGVFEALEMEATSVKSLCSQLDVGERGLAQLLKTLEVTGYLTCSGDSYDLTPMSRTWLLSSSSCDISDMFGFFDDMGKRWDHLEEAVRLGDSAHSGSKWLGEQEGAWNRYHAGLRGLARLVGPEILRCAPLSGSPKRLLDIGGGHGLFSVFYCRKYPLLKATVLDWALAKDDAESTIAAEQMQDQVSFVEGDFHSYEPEQPFDVVLAFNFIRVLPAEQLPSAFSRIGNLLSAQGQLVIMDELGDVPSGSFSEVIKNLRKLEIFNSVKGQSPAADVIIELLRDSGFSNVRFAQPRRTAGLGMVLAEKGPAHEQ